MKYYLVLYLIGNSTLNIACSGGNTFISRFFITIKLSLSDTKKCNKTLRIDCYISFKLIHETLSLFYLRSNRGLSYVAIVKLTF